MTGESRRVRVMSPQTATAMARAGARARPGDRPSFLGAGPERSAIEVAVLTSLVRAQRRLAVGIFLAMGVALGGLPAVLALFPAVGASTILGAPFPWVALGLCTFPLLVGLAAVYVRVSERIEREFNRVLDQ